MPIPWFVRRPVRIRMVVLDSCITPWIRDATQKAACQVATTPPTLTCWATGHATVSDEETRLDSVFPALFSVDSINT